MTKHLNTSLRIQSVFLLAVLTMFSILSIPTASAATAVEREWVEKKYNIKGQWDIVQQGDQTVIRFSDDFKTKNGPDLKIFLSKQTIAEVNGRNATQDSVLLGTLKSPRGGQEYILPAGIDVNDFQTVLIHCEKYSVLWGGGTI